MGMFDSFYFAAGTLPDNKVPPDHDFQTKSLSCDLDRYYVGADGHVKHVLFNSEDERETIDLAPINNEVCVYSHEFIYDNEKDVFNRKLVVTKYQEYKIIILNSRLVFAEKTCDSGYDEPKDSGQ